MRINSPRRKPPTTTDPTLITSTGGTTSDWDVNYGLSSLHTGGAHVTLADGSVRFLSDNMHYGTLCYLAHKSDGNVTGDF